MIVIPGGARFGVSDRAERIRPDAMILGYPVITADEFTHVRTIKNVSGEQPGSSGYWMDGSIAWLNKLFAFAL